MNIVYVSREFGPITGGGIGTYIANACRAMLERGHRVFLITDCVTDANRHLLPDGLVVVATEEMSSDDAGGCFSFNHAYSHRVYRTLRALCLREQVDVVEFPEYCGEGFISIRAKRLMGEFFGQCLVVKCHTPLSLLEIINEDREFAAWVVCDIEMEDYCVRHADRVTSPSLSLAQYFQERVGRKDILSCPYPLFIDFSDRNPPVSSRDLKTIRFFGSVQVRKGVDMFIDAAVLVLAKRPDLRFEIIGNERNAYFFHRSYTDVLKARIPSGMEDRIVFRGGVPYEEVSTLLENSVMIVLPSRWENWANACLESMAKGCVVMASSSGGMAEMIESGVNGWVIDPRDPEALAALLLQTLEDESSLQCISDAAVSRALDLTDPLATAKRMEANYQWDAVPLPSGINDEPLVSVIVPFYNQATTLEQTLESIRMSTYRNVEIVVVNDGSTSPSALALFRNLEGVVKVDQRNGGLSAARNAGIRATKGAYFLPLDADDLLHPDYIRKAVNALQRLPELGYVTCYTRNFEAIQTPYYPVGFVSQLMPFLNTSGKCSNVYRRSVFDRTGGYDVAMNSYEDWDFLLSLADADIEGDVLPEELFYYRRNYASMVFSVANPIRANLIQYMMMKHRGSWSRHSEKMALLLVRLWKDAEILAEAPLHEEFRIYWGLTPSLLNEQQVRTLRYLRQGFTRIECQLPYDSEVQTLRLDFAVSPLRILLHRVRVRDLIADEDVLVFDSERGWAGLVVSGTAVAEGNDRSGAMLIRSTGNDPQVIIDDSRLRGCEMQVCFEFTVMPQGSATGMESIDLS